jgi:hypothetical protein
MTPSQFRSQVEPELIARWTKQCFCSSSQFCKLISYDFRDYGVIVSALLDAQILISSILWKHCEQVGEVASTQGIHVQHWRCHQCNAVYREEEEQYSISMWRNFARRIDRPVPDLTGLFLVGFQSYSGFEISCIPDFAPCPSVEIFIDGITGSC